MILKEMILDNNIGTLPSMGTSYQLNKTSKKIIELLKEGQTKEEIINYFVNKNNEYGEVVKNIEDFMLKLKIIGLL